MAGFFFVVILIVTRSYRSIALCHIKGLILPCCDVEILNECITERIKDECNHSAKNHDRKQGPNKGNQYPPPSLSILRRPWLPTIGAGLSFIRTIIRTGLAR